MRAAPEQVFLGLLIDRRLGAFPGSIERGLKTIEQGFAAFAPFQVRRRAVETVAVSVIRRCWSRPCQGRQSATQRARSYKLHTHDAPVASTDIDRVNCRSLHRF